MEQEPEIIHRPEFKVIGIPIRLKNEAPLSTFFLIGKQIEKQIEKKSSKFNLLNIFSRKLDILKKIPNTINKKEYFGIHAFSDWKSFHENILFTPLDSKGEITNTLTYIIAQEVKTLDIIPKGMISVVIPGARYAVFPIEKDMSKLLAYIYTVWFKKVIYKQRSLPNFELYKDNKENKLYVPVTFPLI